jgi:hypothetical protein
MNIHGWIADDQVAGKVDISLDHALDVVVFIEHFTLSN